MVNLYNLPILAVNLHALTKTSNSVKEEVEVIKMFHSLSIPAASMIEASPDDW